MAGGGRIYTTQVTVGDVSIYDVSGDPNGLLPAPLGSLALETTAARLWQNSDGGTTWVQIGGTALVNATVQVVRFAISAAGGASQDSASNIPSNAIILRAGVEVLVPFSSGAGIQVGKAGGTVNLLSSTDDSDATLAALYLAEQVTSWGAGAAKVRASIAGGPVVGSGFVVVQYVEIPNP